jgi:hypothetical protein
MTLYEKTAKQIEAPIEGVFSQEEQYWTVRPVDEWEQMDRPEWISIGGPGVDGIQFCSCIESNGIHVYYPNEDRFELVAETVPQLVEGWQTGRITV